MLQISRTLGDTGPIEKRRRRTWSKIFPTIGKFRINAYTVYMAEKKDPLRERIEEYPDGQVLAFLDGRCVGQLELQIPYGLSTGYINLYYVTHPFRGLGFGTRMHEYVERYFRSWEATEIELHVARTNEPALHFYRKLGYRYADPEPRNPGLWRMLKAL